MVALSSDFMFETKIPARLAKIVKAEQKVFHVYKFQITVDGKVAKTWILDLKNVKVTEGEGAAEVTLILSDADMAGIGNGTLNAKQALNEDKIDVEGDVNLVMLLEPFLATM